MWTAMLVFSVAVVLSPSREVDASGVFELRLKSFVNEYGKDSLGKCCSGTTSRTGDCSGACKTRFRVCLKQYQVKIDTTSPCTYGDVLTPVLGENVVNFSPGAALPSFTNPIRFPFDFTWPGTFSLIVEAYHEADNTTQHSPARCLPGCDDQHGHCTRPNECVCQYGWKGPFCDQCVRYPGCLHGSCQKPWECLCDEGWGGLFCNQDLNYCTNHKPCLNGGTCFNTGQGSYTCSCAPGFTGTDCETPLVDCHSRPCLNGGSCSMETNTSISTSSSSTTSTSGSGSTELTVLPSSTYRCTCPPGWSGRHCEYSSKSCRDLPCLHGSTCEENPVKGYTCHCTPGYSGPDCETQVDDCSPNPCVNRGSCTDRLNGFQCTCPLGFIGSRCEINVDDCQGDPCLNGATCIDLVNRFRCQCVPGYVGRLCQDKVDYCLAKPCANGGKCSSGTNDYECICKPGFTGKDCSIDVDECRSGPCRNGGTCRNRVNGFLCECPHGWKGETCSLELGAVVPPVSTSLGSSSVPAVPPSGASYWSGNLSRQVASAEARDAGLTTEHVVVIATLSTAVPAFVLVAAVAVMCMKRRQKREQAKADEEARLQNERNAVHSSMSKRGVGGPGGIGGVGIGGVSAVGVGGVVVGGDAHMIKNTWANKSVNNASMRDDLDGSFQNDTLDTSCSGYKPEPVLQERSRTTKQLNTEAAAHRASHLFQKEKECSIGSVGLGVGVLDVKRTSAGLFCPIGTTNAITTTTTSSTITTTESSCCAEALLKRPDPPPNSQSNNITDSGCGVYVIDDHYRHDAALAATLATEV
ncbi:neurogenic locus protein delta isoform X2 [Cephus cinctus]|uniref:Neurogenic locus protein delta isoform X2 n=1 Tax=Cephus cinctus TaxID=211228 RepID=A0AAJ7RRG7_CEPCN|nr:neurogenic locus protein delta isoform X2 [Cephus cinctus]